MLVLKRKLEESIVIDEKITVTVLSIQGDQVRLGITAPRDVPVHRKEIFDRIAAAGVEELAKTGVEP